MLDLMWWTPVRRESSFRPSPLQFSSRQRELQIDFTSKQVRKGSTTSEVWVVDDSQGGRPNYPKQKRYRTKAPTDGSRV